MSMGYALKNEATFDEIECAECGIVFYVSAHWRHNRAEVKTAFYCPNGHSLSYQQSETDRLRLQLDEKTRQLEFERTRAQNLDRRFAQEAGKHRALKNRVKNGVCPCCHRTFVKLAAHIKAKHPDFERQDAR